MSVVNVETGLVEVLGVAATEEQVRDLIASTRPEHTEARKVRVNLGASREELRGRIRRITRTES